MLDIQTSLIGVKRGGQCYDPGGVRAPTTLLHSDIYHNNIYILDKYDLSPWAQIVLLLTINTP